MGNILDTANEYLDELSSRLDDITEREISITIFANLITAQNQLGFILNEPSPNFMIRKNIRLRINNTLPDGKYEVYYPSKVLDDTSVFWKLIEYELPVPIQELISLFKNKYFRN